MPFGTFGTAWKKKKRILRALRALLYNVWISAKPLHMSLTIFFVSKVVPQLCPQNNTVWTQN